MHSESNPKVPIRPRPSVGCDVQLEDWHAAGGSATLRGGGGGGGAGEGVVWGDVELASEHSQYLARPRSQVVPPGHSPRHT